MNDVPLVKDNKINDINTSIIAIKKQLKQLNEAVGLIDISDTPDLSPYVKKSDIVDIVASGNMNAVTSNAVAGVLNGKLDTNVYTDVDLNTILDFGMYRIQCPSGNYSALHFPINGWGVLTVIKPANNDTSIVQMFIADYSPVIYMRYINLATSTFNSWQAINDVTQITVTIDTNHITNYGNNAWVNCYKSGKVVTVSVEVNNGSGSLTANTLNRIAFGFPIPANGIVNGNINIDNYSIFQRVWIDNGNLYVWVGDNYTGNLFATVTYIEA